MKEYLFIDYFLIVPLFYTKEDCLYKNINKDRKVFKS